MTSEALFSEGKNRAHIHLGATMELRFNPSDDCRSVLVSSTNYSPSLALYSPPPVAWMIFLISSSSAIEPGSGLIDILRIFFTCKSKPVLSLSVASAILVMRNSRIQVRQVSLEILSLKN